MKKHVYFLFFLFCRIVPSVKDLIYLTIDVEDIDPKVEVKLDNSTLYFHGKAGHDKKTYEVRLEFYEEVDPKVGVTHFQHISLIDNVEMII